MAKISSGIIASFSLNNTNLRIEIFYNNYSRIISEGYWRGLLEVGAITCYNPC